MQSNPLHDLLIDPETQESLEYQANSKRFRSSSNEYLIQQGVPILLKGQEASVRVGDLHEGLQSDFDYQDHYQKDAEFFNYFEEAPSATTRDEINRLHEVIIKKVPASAELILDVGCGNAWLAKHFVSKGKQVISMDISSTNPIKARAEVPDENHLAVVGDVFNLPIKKNSVDCIIASEIMEHVADPKQFIACLVAALKPNGKLIITTPYNEKREFCMCVHCNKPTPRFAHLHSFQERNIEQLIPKEIAKWDWDKFSNNYFLKARIYRMMRFLPHFVWRSTDKIANKLFPKPLRLLIEITK